MDKVIHWLREKTGIYMLNAHLDGIYDRLKQQDEKIQELEQENEQLKKSIDRIMQNKEIKTIDLDIAKENAELKAENERLKEENYQLQKDCQICENFIDFIPCKPIRDMDYDLQKVISQRDNYYQALQEIREIAGFHTSKDDSEDVQSDMQDILDKINEVIGAE